MQTTDARGHGRSAARCPRSAICGPDEAAPIDRDLREPLPNLGLGLKSEV